MTQPDDSDKVRRTIKSNGAEAVIPKDPSRVIEHPLDKHLHAQRHLIECCVFKPKRFRRIALQYETTARNYIAMIAIAAALLWLR